MTFAEYTARPAGGVRTEFVGGKVFVLESPTFECSDLRDALIEMLRPFVRERRIGFVASSCEFQTIPGRTRCADICVFQASRFNREYSRLHVVPIVPDLAVEVLSPNDTFGGVRERVAEYLAAGVETVWLLYPLTQEGEVCTNGHREYPVRSLTAACLPGLEIDVAKLFTGLQVPHSATRSGIV